MNITTNQAPFLALRSEWRVCKPITHVTHDQGALWSAMWRHAYNPFLKEGEDFHQVGLIPVPADSGVIRYEAGDPLALGLILPAAEADRFLRVIARLRSAPGVHGQFEPGNTLALEGIHCRRTGLSWPAHPAAAITPACLAAAAARLAHLPACHLHLASPLRVALPPADKTSGREFCDPAWLYAADDPGAHLFKALFPPGEAPVITAAMVHWLSVRYGRPGPATRLGGLTGWLRLRGPIGPEAAAILVRHQWLGVGKNRAFGFGRYRIAEIPDLLAPLPRRRYLLSELDEDRAAYGATVVPFGPARPATKVEGVARRLGDALEAITCPGRRIRGRGLEVAVTVDWEREDATGWLRWLDSLFPNEPLVGELHGWLREGDGVPRRFAGVLNQLTRLLLAQAITPDRAALNPNTGALTFPTDGPEADRRLAATCMARCHHWGLTTARWQFSGKRQAASSKRQVSGAPG